jgi:hypothetical protein
VEAHWWTRPWAHGPELGASWLVPAAAIALAALIGAAVAAMIAAPRLLAGSGVDARPVAITPVVAAVATPTAAALVRRPPVTAAAGAPVAAPPAPAAASEVAPPETADSAWQQTELQLEAAWNVDTPRTVVILDAFVARFPDYAFARPKLYAALLSYGQLLDAQGAPDQAAALRARAAVVASEIVPPTEPAADDSTSG